MLVHQPASVFYSRETRTSTSMTTSAWSSRWKGGQPSGPQGDLSRAQLTSWVSRMFSVPVGGNPAHALAAILEEQGFSRSRIGVAKLALRAPGLSVQVYESLLTALPNASFVDASGLPEVSR